MSLRRKKRKAEKSVEVCFFFFLSFLFAQNIELWIFIRLARFALDYLDCFTRVHYLITELETALFPCHATTRVFNFFFGATLALFFLGFGFVFYKADFSYLVKTFIRIFLTLFSDKLELFLVLHFYVHFSALFFHLFFAFFPFLFQPSKKKSTRIWVERRNNRFVPNSRLICVRKWKNSPFSLMQKKERRTKSGKSP